MIWALGESPDPVQDSGPGDAGEVNGQWPKADSSWSLCASCPLVGPASWSKAGRPGGCELGWESQNTSPTNPGGDPIPAAFCLSGSGSPLPRGRSSSRLSCLGHTGLLPNRVLNAQHQNRLLGVISHVFSVPHVGKLLCSKKTGLHTHPILILTMSLQVSLFLVIPCFHSLIVGPLLRPQGNPIPSCSSSCHCFSVHTGFQSF